MAKKSRTFTPSRPAGRPVARHAPKKGPPAATSDAPKRGRGRPRKEKVSEGALIIAGALSGTKAEPEAKPAFGTIKGATTKPKAAKTIEVDAELVGNLQQLAERSERLAKTIAEKIEERDALKEEMKEHSGKRTPKAEELSFDLVAAMNQIEASKAKRKEVTSDINKLIKDIGKGQRVMPKVLSEPEPDPANDPIGRDEPDDPDQEVIPFAEPEKAWPAEKFQDKPADKPSELETQDARMGPRTTLGLAGTAVEA